MLFCSQVALDAGQLTFPSREGLHALSVLHSPEIALSVRMKLLEVGRTVVQTGSFQMQCVGPLVCRSRTVERRTHHAQGANNFSARFALFGHAY